MIEKYRVSEVAKDLGASSKELIALLDGQFPGEGRKSQTVLSTEELNFVFEKYTRDHSVENLDGYFALKEQEVRPAPKASEAPAVPKAEEKPAAKAQPAQPEKETPAPAAEAPKAAPQPAQEVRPAPKAPEAPAAPKPAEAPQRPAAPAASGRPAPAKVDFVPGQRTYNNRTVYADGSRPAGQQGGQNQGGQRSFGQGQGGQRSFGQNQGGQRPFGQNQGGQRSFGQNQGGQRPFGQNQGGQRSFGQNQGGQRSFGQNQGGQRSFGQNQGGQRPAPQQTSRPLPPPPVFEEGKPIEIKMQQPKPKVKNGQSAPRPTGPVTNVVVDMRSSEVNLERYNEHYEQIAPAAQKEMVVKKQKLNQRSAARRGKPVMSRKEREEEKLRRLELEKQRRQRLEVTLPEEITVGELAALLKVQAAEIIKKLMQNGVMATVNEVLDYDTAALVAMEIGAKVSKEVVVTIEDRLFEQEEDDSYQEPRCPIVVVMGHVDHGKTSLLDAIRHTAVVAGEAGGITQHIGAYQVEIDGKPITFLDTPGHAAFTSMRARGAQVTDIAVLVVAADDGIMPQTIEAINHAKAAGVSIIVAINKMDKPHANPDKVMQQLTEYDLVPEEWGGDVICVPVSAKTRQGLDDLLENILLVAEVKELKANPRRMAKGTVIEAKLDKGRGPVATVLIQNGTLHTGDIIIAGTAVGRVRVMVNDKGAVVDTAGPSVPVEITGLADVPDAGDIFNAVEDERLARELAEQRRMEAKEEQFKAYQKVTLDNLFEHITEGEMLELPIIVKADVQGSVEAVKQSLIDGSLVLTPDYTN